MKTNESTSPASDHEHRDADVVSLTMVAGLFLICGLLVIFACLGLIHFFNFKDKARQTHAPSPVRATAQFPEPRLQAKPAAELEKFRAAEEQQLNSYGWIDRFAGIVRIPIERAMELIVQRGLPEVGANKTPLQLMQERPQQSETPVPTPNMSR